MSWDTFRKYFFNIDTVVFIIIAIIVLYFILTRERKTYTLLGVDEFGAAIYKESNGLSHTGKSRIVPATKKPKKLNKHEEECRRIFEKLFGVTFRSIRPKWLKNPITKRNLELDGYNADIETPIGSGLAFEYDGQQHAQYNSHFHKGGKDEFVYQVKKDLWKNEKCKDRGVLLIRIPHFVAFHDLERYIKTELDRQKIVLPSLIFKMDRNIYD